MGIGKKAQYVPFLNGLLNYDEKSVDTVKKLPIKCGVGLLTIIRNQLIS